MCAAVMRWSPFVRWRKLTLFYGSVESLNVRTLACTPLHSLEEPLEVLDPLDLGVSNEHISPTGSSSVSGGAAYADQERAQELAWVGKWLRSIDKLLELLGLRTFHGRSMAGAS